MKQIKIKSIYTGLLSLLVCFPALSYAGKFPAVIKTMPYSYEVVASEILTIQSVSKKLIKVSGKNYAIGAITKVVDSKGKLVDASVLKKGMDIKIKFDDQQRYLNQPTLSAIYIN